MKIQTKKAVQDGVTGRIILKIKGALLLNQLPSKYKVSSNIYSFYRDTYPDRTTYLLGRYEDSRKFSILLEEGNFYPEETFQDILSYLKKCGAFLHKINQEIEKLKISWQGEETFII